MTEHPTTAWQAMQGGNVFYRRQQLYSLPGKLPDLGDYVVAGCRHGGPFGETGPIIPELILMHPSSHAGHKQDDSPRTFHTSHFQVSNSGLFTRGRRAAAVQCG